LCRCYTGRRHRDSQRLLVHLKENGPGELRTTISVN